MSYHKTLFELSERDIEEMKEKGKVLFTIRTWFDEQGIFHLTVDEYGLEYKMYEFVGDPLVLYSLRQAEKEKGFEYVTDFRIFTNKERTKYKLKFVFVNKRELKIALRIIRMAQHCYVKDEPGYAIVQVDGRVIATHKELAELGYQIFASFRERIIDVARDKVGKAIMLKWTPRRLRDLFFAIDWDLFGVMLGVCKDSEYEYITKHKELLVEYYVRRGMGKMIVFD